MGAWGVLAFDNDEACDWAYDLEGVDDLSLVEAAFVEIEKATDYLDAHEACNALAACEVLARLRGKRGYSNPYTETVDNWVASHPIDPPAKLLARAQGVIDRTLSDKSELRDLWDESGELGVEWGRSVEELRERLRA